MISLLTYRCLMFAVVCVALVRQGKQGDHEQSDTSNLQKVDESVNTD